MPASSIEALYTSTLLSGVAYEVCVRAQGVGCTHTTMNQLLKDFQLRCSAIASQRSQQAVLDVLVRRTSSPGVRTAHPLCTPHFPHDLAHTKIVTRWSRRSVRKARVRTHARNASVRKATPRAKARLDLAMRLWYTLQRCLRRRTTSCGALLPYSVATRKDLRVSRKVTSATGRNHANFIYLHFDHKNSATTRVRCVLIEPNGPAAARAYKDGFTRLRHAWAQLVNEGVVVKGHRLQLQSNVDILGDKGAHTVNEVERNLHALVSPRRVSTRRHRSRHGRIHKTTTTHYEGHGAGICGAVTHWIVHRWLRADTSRTLEDVYAELCAWAAASPQEALDDLKAFMQDVRTQTRAVYTDNVDAALRRDMTALQTALRTTYGPMLESGHCVLSCVYTFRQGTETLYQATHEIVVQST